MSPLLELSVNDGVPSVHVGVEPSALPVGGVHVSPPPPRLLPPLSTLNDDFVSLPPLPLPLPLLSKWTSDMLHRKSLLKKKNISALLISLDATVTLCRDTTVYRNGSVLKLTKNIHNSLTNYLPDGVVIILGKRDVMYDPVMLRVSSRQNWNRSLMMTATRGQCLVVWSHCIVKGRGRGGAGWRKGATYKKRTTISPNSEKNFFYNFFSSFLLVS